MKYTSITLNMEDAVALLTLDNPKNMNALDSEMKEDLARGIEEVRSNDSIKAVVITGSGKAFCAGGDVNSLATVNTATAGRERIKTLHRWVADLINLEKPVIAAVNGYAVGAGCNLALASDIIIASTNAQFSEIFSKVGLIPDAGGLYFLPRLVGPAKAKELVFTGRMVGAEEAARIGLINKVVKPEELLSEAIALARQLAQGPSKALGLAKTLINRSLSWDLATLLENEALAQGLCLQTEDFQEGVRAFKEKREPKFSGR